MKLPERTVERLSQYRRVLLDALKDGRTHIYSHELADMHNSTAVQVRRDLMLIGYSAKQKKGYDIRELTEVIGNVLDIQEGQKIAVIGFGNLGKAIVSYFRGKRGKLKVAATFDVDPEKVNRVLFGINCYHINMLPEIVKKENITIGILTVPSEYAVAVSEKLVIAGVKGILNFTSVPLNVSPHIYLENFDIITSVEKVAYFVKKQIFE